MNTQLFWSVLLGGYSLILLQWVVAIAQGWGFRSQLGRRGEVGFPLSEHGGVWIDTILVTWLVAWIAAKHDLRLVSDGGLTALVVVIASVIVVVKLFEKLPFREAYQRNGHTTAVGWLHAVYAVGAAWILARFYLGAIKPLPTSGEFVAVSSCLTVFFPVGVMKFGGGWRPTSQDAVQVLSCIAIVWIVAATMIAIYR